jgi:hypothetical protein
MNTQQRVELVRLLGRHLGDDDITERHVILDKVDKRMLLHAAQGIATELCLDILGATAMGAIDCRLIFDPSEANEQTVQFVNKGLAVFINENEYPD